MLLDQNKGILYPEDFKIEKKTISDSGPKPEYFEIPHKSLDLCKDQMDEVFSKAANFKASHIFVLAPLHKGKINYDDRFCIYSYEDSFVNYPLINRNNCVCSEEYSYEIALPYLKEYFPQAQTTAFFAPENSEKLKDFICFLKTSYPDSLFFVSNNAEANCSQMWKQAF